MLFGEGLTWCQSFGLSNFPMRERERERVTVDPVADGWLTGAMLTLLIDMRLL